MDLFRAVITGCMGVVIDRTDDDLDAVERQICNVAYPQKTGSSGLPGDVLNCSARPKTRRPR